MGQRTYTSLTTCRQVVVPSVLAKTDPEFCHDVHRILEKAGRGDDYLEIGLGGAWQWNPLDDPLLDTYSLAYSVASLINQLFGKSREPFWQQAYTNLVRWISGVRMS